MHYPEILNVLDRVGGNGRISVFRITENKSGKLFDLLGIKRTLFQSSVQFDTTKVNVQWYNVPPNTQDPVDSTNRVLHLNASIEFGPTLHRKTTENVGGFLLFQGALYSKEIPHKRLQVIASIASADGTVEYYRYYTVNIPNANRWFDYQCLFALPRRLGPGKLLKCYIWNQGRGEYFVDDLVVTRYE